jgi:hypothetical protein
MRKGVTRLALYGLSHLKDERLARLYMDYKVSVLIIHICCVDTYVCLTFTVEELWIFMFAENKGFTSPQ